MYAQLVRCYLFIVSLYSLFLPAIDRDFPVWIIDC